MFGKEVNEFREKREKLNRILTRMNVPRNLFYQSSLLKKVLAEDFVNHIYRAEAEEILLDLFPEKRQGGE